MADPALQISAELIGLEKSAQRALANIEKQARIRIQVDDKASLPLGRISKNASEVESSLDAATSRVVAFGAAAAVFATVAKGFDTLVTSIIEVEDALTRININFGATSDGLKNFGKEVFNAARNSAKSFEEAAKAAEELARQGLGVEETTKRLNDALLLSRRAGIDSADAVETLTAAYNSFNASGLDTTEILNKLVAVDTRFAVSTKDLSDAIARAASTAQEAGVTFDEFLGIVTAVQQTTARGGAVIGNALKTIFTRVQAAPETIKALEAVGVAITDSSGAFTSAGDRLRQYAQIRNSLSEGDRAFYDRQISGTQQINILTAALGDLAKANGVAAQAQKISLGATNEAIVQNEKLNQTLKSVIAQTGASFTELFAKIGAESGDRFKGVLQFVNELTGGLIESDKVAQGFANVLSGPAFTAALILLGKVFAVVGTDLAKALSAITGLNAQSRERAKIEQEIAFFTANATNEEIKQLNAATSLTERKAAYLAIEQRVTAEKERQALIDRQLQGAFVGQSKISRATGGIIGGGITSDLNFKSLSRGFPRQANSSTQGVIPRFADPLKEAIFREKAAGVPANQIYVDTDPRVKGPGNPLGLLVANKRDEPLGGFQGVNRAIKEGANPRNYGTKTGVPNFATFDRIKDSSLKDIKGVLLSPSEIDSINKEIIEYGGALLSESKALRRQTKERLLSLALDKESKNLIELALEEEGKSYALIKKENKQREKAAKFTSRIVPGSLSPSIIFRGPRSAAGDFGSTQTQSLGASGLASDILGNPFLTSRAQKKSAQQNQLSDIVSDLKFQQRFSATRGDLSKLSGQDFKRLQDQARSEAIKNLGLQEVSTSILENDKNAQKLILAERNKILSKIREVGKVTAQIAEQATQAQRIQGISGKLGSGLGVFGSIFGSEARDRKRIGNVRAGDEEVVGELLRAREEKRFQRRNNLALGAAFALPFAAGLLPEGRGGTGGGIGLGATSGALQGAGVGGLFGPVGLAVGAAAGGLVGAFNKLKKSAEEYGQEFEKNIELQNQNISALSESVQIQDQLNNAVDSSAINKLLKRQSSVFSNLSPELRKEVIGAGGNVDKISNIIGRETERRDFSQRSSSAVQQALGIGGTAGRLGFSRLKNNFDISDSLGGQFGNILSTELADKILGSGRAITSTAFSTGEQIPEEQIKLLQSFFSELAKTAPEFKAISVNSINFRELARSLLQGSIAAKQLTKDQQQLNEISKKISESNRSSISFSSLTREGASPLRQSAFLSRSRFGISEKSRSQEIQDRAFLDSLKTIEDANEGVLPQNLAGLKKGAQGRLGSVGATYGLEALVTGLTGRTSESLGLTGAEGVLNKTSVTNLAKNLAQSTGTPESSREQLLALIEIERQKQASGAGRFSNTGSSAYAGSRSLATGRESDRFTGLTFPRSSADFNGVFGAGPTLITPVTPESNLTQQIQAAVINNKDAVTEMKALVAAFIKALEEGVSVKSAREVLLKVSKDESFSSEFEGVPMEQVLKVLAQGAEFSQRIETLENKNGIARAPKIPNLNIR